MSEWYLKHGDKEYGPMDTNKLRQLAAQNKVRPTDYIRRGADGKWTLASHAKGLFNDAVPNAPSAPSPINVQSGDNNTNVSHPIPPVAPPNPAFTQTPNVQTPVAPPVASPMPVAQKASSSTSSSMSFGDGLEFSNASSPSAPSPKKGKKGKKKAMDKKTILIASIAGGSVLVLILVGVLIYALSSGNKNNNVASDNKSKVEQSAQENKKTSEENGQTDVAANENEVPSNEDEQASEENAQEEQSAEQNGIPEKVYDSANESAKLGDLEIKIVSAKQGAEPIIKKNGADALSASDATIIEISVCNTNQETKVKFTPWSVLMSQGKAKNLSLRDKNNTYDYLLKAGEHPKNAESETQTLFSDHDPVKDYLIFEHFVPGAKELFLTLPVPGDPNQTVTFRIDTENVGKAPAASKLESAPVPEEKTEPEDSDIPPINLNAKSFEDDNVNFDNQDDEEISIIKGVSEEDQKKEETELEAELKDMMKD